MAGLDFGCQIENGPHGTSPLASKHEAVMLTWHLKALAVLVLVEEALSHCVATPNWNDDGRLLLTRMFLCQQVQKLQRGRTRRVCSQFAMLNAVFATATGLRSSS